jgi:hypothetical protein
MQRLHDTQEPANAGEALRRGGSFNRVIRQLQLLNNSNTNIFMGSQRDIPHIFTAPGCRKIFRPKIGGCYSKVWFNTQRYPFISFPEIGFTR